MSFALLLLIAAFVSPVSGDARVCSQVSNQDGKCYDLITTAGRLSNAGAMAVCEARTPPGRLARIDHPQDQMDVRDAAGSDDFWIAGYARNTYPLSWYWHRVVLVGNEVRMAVEALKPEEAFWNEAPIDDLPEQSPKEFCAFATMPSLAWTASNCGLARKPLCEYVDVHGTVRYIILPNTGGWYGAQKACRDESLKLAVVRTEQDRRRVIDNLAGNSQLIPGEELWIGLTSQVWYYDYEFTSMMAWYGMDDRALRENVFQTCLYLAGDRASAWVASDCLREAFVICEAEERLPTTIAVVEGTTTLPVTTTMTFTPRTITAKDTGLPAEFTVAIVVVIVLCVGIIVGVVAWMLCKRSNDSDAVDEDIETDTNNGKSSGSHSSFAQPSGFGGGDGTESDELTPRQSPKFTSTGPLSRPGYQHVGSITQENMALKHGGLPAHRPASGPYITRAIDPIGLRDKPDKQVQFEPPPFVHEIDSNNAQGFFVRSSDGHIRPRHERRSSEDSFGRATHEESAGSVQSDDVYIVPKKGPSDDEPHQLTPGLTADDITPRESSTGLGQPAAAGRYTTFGGGGTGGMATNKKW